MPLLHDGIPGVAVRTFAHPLGRLIPAALADKDCFQALLHDSKLSLDVLLFLCVRLSSTGSRSNQDGTGAGETFMEFRILVIYNENYSYFLWIIEAITEC